MKDDMTVYTKYITEAMDRNDLDFAIAVFRVYRNMLIRKKKIVVIVSAHTVEQGRRDRMAVGIAKP